MYKRHICWWQYFKTSVIFSEIHRVVSSLAFASAFNPGHRFSSLGPRAAPAADNLPAGALHSLPFGLDGHFLKN